jgi:hypothetical protein
MARSRSTFGKMQREQEKRSRARAKQEKRFARREDEPEEDSGTVTTAEDQASILEALAQLHEDFAEGRISLDDFEERQEELRSSIRVD